jgi:hypothetical protein
MLILTIRKVKKVRNLPAYQSSVDIRLWTSALWAAMAAYLAGAMFSSTEYNLFPYFMVGYVCAIYQIASKPQSADDSRQNENRNGSKKVAQGSGRERDLVWSR